MIILIGPSASGKTEIAKYLISNFSFEKFVTTTTRAPRVGEINDVDYHFIDTQQFKDLISKNKFIEYVNYNDNFYGTTLEEIDDKKVLILEPKGLIAFKKLNDSKIVSFYIDASLETRKERMILRKDDPKEITKRIENDDIYFESAKKEASFIIKNNNDTSIKDSANKIYEIYQDVLSKLN